MQEIEHPRLPGFPILPVTVVGSYPLTPSPADTMRAYYDKRDPYLQAIELSVREQAEAGVQIITDGQTRASMVDIFASRLAGIRMKGKPVVFSEVRFTGPITLKDQECALGIIGQLPDTGPQLKGIITGPHTMSQSVRDDHYNDEKELAMDLAKALNAEACALQKKVPMIQFDEPYLSVNFIDYFPELMAELVKGITIPVSLHVCGDVTPIFSDLIELPVTILDHEFTHTPSLHDVISEYDFKQLLGYGMVRSDHGKVESVEQIRKRMERAVTTFGVENLLVDPDCGLRHVTPEVAFQKLRNLRVARDAVLKDYPPDS